MFFIGKFCQIWYLKKNPWISLNIWAMIFDLANHRLKSVFRLFVFNSSKFIIIIMFFLNFKLNLNYLARNQSKISRNCFFMPIISIFYIHDVRKTRADTLTKKLHSALLWLEKLIWCRVRIVSLEKKKSAYKILIFLV